MRQMSVLCIHHWCSVLRYATSRLLTANTTQNAFSRAIKIMFSSGLTSQVAAYLSELLFFNIYILGYLSSQAEPSAHSLSTEQLKQLPPNVNHLSLSGV